MKILKITDDVEKGLIKVFDEAYKNAGFGLHFVVHGLLSKIEEVKDEVKKEVEGNPQ